MKLKLGLVSGLTTAMYFGFTNLTMATTNALTNAGIKAQDINADTGGLFADLKTIVYVVMGLGGLWSVAWLVIGGMLLAGSGSNPQKRSGGLAAIGVACLGLFVIYKAFDIAGWAVNLAGVQ